MEVGGHLKGHLLSPSHLFCLIILHVLDLAHRAYWPPSSETCSRARPWRRHASAHAKQNTLHLLVVILIHSVAFLMMNVNALAGYHDTTQHFKEFWDSVCTYRTEFIMERNELLGLVTGRLHRSRYLDHTTMFLPSGHGAKFNHDSIPHCILYAGLPSLVRPACEMTFYAGLPIIFSLHWFQDCYALRLYSINNKVTSRDHLLTVRYHRGSSLAGESASLIWQAPRG